MENEQDFDLKELREEVNKISFEILGVGEQFQTMIERARKVFEEVANKSIQADVTFKREIISLFVKHHPDIAGFVDANVIAWIKQMADTESESSD